MKIATYGLVGASALAYTCCYTVNPGERAIIMDKFYGLKQAVYEPGLRFYFPLNNQN